MRNQKKFIVSHAPFIHNGSGIFERNLHTIYAALPAVVFGGVFRFGASAIAVVCFSVATAMIWELLMNQAMKRPVTIGDGNAAALVFVGLGASVFFIEPLWGVCCFVIAFLFGLTPAFRR